MRPKAYVHPNYEVKLNYDRKLLMVALLLAFVDALLFLVFVAEEWARYAIIILSIWVLMLISLVALRRFSKGSEDNLVRFVNSMSNLIRSWTIVGPTITGKYNGYCELTDGYYASLEQDMSRHSGYKAVMLSIYKFIEEPEHVARAPLSKWTLDERTLRFTSIPFGDKMWESWRKSDEKWKKAVSEDANVRSWIDRNYDWKANQYLPTAKGVYSIVMRAFHGYQRNPRVRDGWLKGRWLSVNFVFRNPSALDEDQLGTLSLGMISVGMRIIRHIEEGIGASFAIE